MWYVIQTTTGKEEELLLFTRAVLSEELRESCFVIKAEWLKRIGGAWSLQVRPLFPGYIFIETEQPERLYLEIRKIPKYARLLGTGRFDFVPVRDEEEIFLKKISGMNRTGGTDQVNKKNLAGTDETGMKTVAGQENGGQQKSGGQPPEPLVRLTAMELSEDGTVLSMDGALRYFKDEVLRLNLHKRYAVVKTRMLGQERTLLFGLRLQGDTI